MATGQDASAGVGRRIRALRVQAGLTQADLAIAIGTTREAITQIERRGSPDWAKRVRALAEALKCHPGELFEPLSPVSPDRVGGRKRVDLYDEDFYAWTQEQAKALRTHFRGDNRIDVEHLAEEIEDLGKSELHAVESYVEQIIAHLLKLDYSGQGAPRSRWRAEILNFRQNVERKITPSIRRRIESDLAALYEHGRQIAAVGALPHEYDLTRQLPRTCPYDWNAIWHRDVVAEAGIDLSDRSERAGRIRRKRGV